MAVPFSNTKIRVPAGFRNILEGFAREVLRDQPNDIYVYGSLYFDRLLQIRAESGYDPAEIGAKEEDYMYNTDSFKRAALEAQSKMDNEAAALIIQTKYRQYSAKKNVNEMRQNRAAVKIQSAFRGHRDRKYCRDIRKSSLCESEKAKLVAEAEDAEEFEQEGDSPHGIYITDIPDRKVGSGKPKEVAEKDTTEAPQPVAAEAGVTENTEAGSDESQEEKKESEEDEQEDVINDMEDAATRIKAGLRGLAHRMTLKSGKLADSQPGGGKDEEEEVEEEKDDTVGRDPSGVSPAAGSESTEEVRQKTSVEKKEEPAGEET